MPVLSHSWTGSFSIANVEFRSDKQFFSPAFVHINGYDKLFLSVENDK